MSTNQYDVIIIGSGAGGGTLALKLAASVNTIHGGTAIVALAMCGLSFVVTRKLYQSEATS
jgi:pyruvate/2-oxoglutarate dehydrogenase complex dihydrolipoamide dehydrogenase (E3) component